MGALTFIGGISKMITEPWLFIEIIAAKNKTTMFSAKMTLLVSLLGAFSVFAVEGFCARNGLSMTKTIGYGTDPVEELDRLLKQTLATLPDCVVFANKLILPAGRRITEMLHNQTTLSLQRRLHSEGTPLIILPITFRQ